MISAFEPTPLDNVRPMRFMGIADAALEKGHRITFFTGSFNHFNKTQRYHSTTYRSVVKHRYELVYIHSRPYTRNISYRRMVAHLDLANKLMAEIKSRKDLPDAVFISFPPISTVHKIIQWGEEKKIPVIVDIIDPWPDVFLKVFPGAFRGTAKSLMSPFYHKLKNILNSCSGITAISETYLQWAETFYTGDKPTACFYPAVQFPEITNTVAKLRLSLQKKEGRLRMIYTGSLAGSYDIAVILKAAEILEKKYPGKTEFAIAGNGPQESMVKAKAGELNNVKYLGWLNHEDIYREFCLSDLGLIQHTNGATQSVTYKLFDYLSAGLPVLNSLNGEMAAIIKENKAGMNNKSEDPASLADNIEKFILDESLLGEYRRNAVLFAENAGDSAKVYYKLIGFVESVVSGKRNKFFCPGKEVAV